jgi:glucose-1-phosphate cytidylyltransferase
MKVVLFCGGLGTRLREHSDAIPKSLVPVGYRPILWHLMKYYAHFGHRDFILCLGYRGDLIRDYFLQYRETLTNDFTWSRGGRDVELHSSDMDDWRITFVETGLHSTIAQRLVKARRYLGEDEIFLANYSDGLSALPLDRQVAEFRASQAVASFAAVHTPHSFHAVSFDADGTVVGLGPMHGQDMYINGGFFVFRREIFDYVDGRDEMVERPFARLVAERRLLAYRWNGFWQCMDTFKDKIAFDRMEARDNCPWMVWKTPPAETLVQSALRAAQQSAVEEGRRGGGNEPELQPRPPGDAQEVGGTVGQIQHP